MRAALLSLLLAVATAGLAQPGALPPWIVPVLRLVSETHVQPTTGIVLPGGGRVLVALDFATADDEIVVLDGGTDIVRHGRPARIEQAFPEFGLKVLAVPGLQRPGAPLAPSMPAERAGVRLAAFPPAEQIAEGQPPVDWRGALQPQPGGGVAFSGSDRPNVSGPLLDDCDNLLGVSLAAGLPTLAAADGTRYRWREDLQSVWNTLGLPLTGHECATPVAGETPAAAEPAALAQASEALQEEPPAVAAEPAPEPETEPAAEPEAPPVSELEPPAESPTPEVQAPAEGEAAAPPAPDRTAWWMLAALLLAGGGLGAYLWRRRRSAGLATSGGETVAESSAEPAEVPARAEAAASAEGVLVLSGRYADGRPCERQVAVDPAAIRLVLGRGGADIDLDSPAVSRRHARLEGGSGLLTLADLGSSNGSSVDGVPCLEGEVLYVEAGAQVVLGDVRFTLEVRAADLAGEP